MKRKSIDSALMTKIDSSKVYREARRIALELQEVFMHLPVRHKEVGYTIYGKLGVGFVLIWNKSTQFLTLSNIEAWNLTPPQSREVIVNPDFIIDGHCHPFQEIPIASLDDWNTFDSFREKAYSLSLISGRDAIVRLTNEGEVIIHKKGDSNNAKARYGELPELDQMEINAESLFVRATGKRIALIGVILRHGT